MSVLRGAVLGGRYAIERRIGEGGMADVLLARDRAEGDRPVVVKRCKAHLKHQPEFAHLFLREARLASLVRHPNVVTLEATGEDDGQPYLVMEYLQGFTVRDVYLRAATKGGIPQDVAAAIVLGSARGLQAAHSARDEQGNRIGLVHRDVSPHNLFLTDAGQVKVLDFGIAKGAHDVTMTRQGHVKGKASYLAPEQLIAGGPVDMRADLFSLGIVAWELFTGRRLFKRASETDTINAIRSLQVPNPISLRPELDPTYAEVVTRLLARNPADRPQHGGEVVSALTTAMRRRAPQLGEKELAEYVALVRTIAPIDETGQVPPQAPAPLDRAAKRRAFDEAWGNARDGVPGSRRPTPLRAPEEVTSTVAPPVPPSFVNLAADSSGRAQPLDGSIVGTWAVAGAERLGPDSSGGFELDAEDLLESSKAEALPPGAIADPPGIPPPPAFVAEPDTSSDAPTSALPAAQLEPMPPPPLVPRHAPISSPPPPVAPARRAYPPSVLRLFARYPEVERLVHANPKPELVAAILAGALLAGLIVSYVIVSIAQ